jgi:hypothetical protein
VRRYCRRVPLHWQPLGPESVATYWRRRVVVAVLAAVLLAALVAGAVAAASALSGDADDTLSVGDATASPGAPEDRSGDATESPAQAPPVPVCADDDLEVQTTAPVADVGVGSSLSLTIAVRNTGDVACRRGLGQGAVEIVITSGEDRIWSSDDCAPGGDEGEVVLEPGASQSARATWPGTRSAPDCPPDQPAAQPGTYRLNGRVGELVAPGMVFRVQG